MVVLLVLVAPLGTYATTTKNSVQIFQGIRYIKQEQTSPHKQISHIVEIDLGDPEVRFMTTPGNGEEGPRETWCETTRAFVKRTGAQVGINGNFFINDTEPHTELLGLAVSAGDVVSPWDKGWAKYAVNIGKDNKVTFVKRAEGGSGTCKIVPEVKLFNALSGNEMLVSGGKIQVSKDEEERHPRTGIGKTDDNKLLLLVVDGRQPGYSVGMTYHEMATLFLLFGAVEALALDGGGSTTLVFSDPEPRVINVPLPMKMPGGFVIKPPGIERKNGNNLAIFAAPLEEKADKPASPP